MGEGATARDFTNRGDGINAIEDDPLAAFDNDDVDDDAKTKVPGEVQDRAEVTHEISEIIALAPGEEDDELTDLVAVASMPVGRARPSQAPPVKAPPAPPRPPARTSAPAPIARGLSVPAKPAPESGAAPPPTKRPLPAPSAPSGDTFDVMLSELEADS